jgi:hypothetical protein
MCVRSRGDQHGGQQRGAAGEDQAVDGDDDRRALQVLELGMLDLAVDLRQALLAAHGQHGVAEGHQNAKQPRIGTSLVPLRNPSASSLNLRCATVGGGGR